MTYAKLIDGAIQYAPHKLRGETTTTYNPPAEMLEAEGYKAAACSELPSQAPAGFCWSEVWTEEDDCIRQGWVLTEQVEASADEAIEYLFGGES